MIQDIKWSVKHSITDCFVTIPCRIQIYITSHYKTTNKLCILQTFFIFSYPYMVEKKSTLFLNQIFDVEFLLHLHESKKLHLFFCMWVCDRERDIITTQKQITARNSNLIF